MIEVNLLPGGSKRARKGRGLGLPKLNLFGGGQSVDRYVLFFLIAAVVAVGYMGLSFFLVGGRTAELEERLEAERQDSIRFAAQIEQVNRLTERRDLLAQRVQVIQAIDAGRYVWPHLLDEVAAAVPDYLWLREITYVGDNPLQVRIAGQAGSIYAVTSFMRRLEVSRFLRNAELQSTQQQPSQANPADLVQVFELLVTYEAPPLDELETVPLLEGEAAAARAAAAAGGN